MSKSLGIAALPRGFCDLRSGKIRPEGERENKKLFILRPLGVAIVALDFAGHPQGGAPTASGLIQRFEILYTFDKINSIALRFYPLRL